MDQISTSHSSPVSVATADADGGEETAARRSVAALDSSPLQYSSAAASVRRKKETAPLTGGSNQPLTVDAPAGASHAAGIVKASRRVEVEPERAHLTPRSPSTVDVVETVSVARTRHTTRSFAMPALPTSHGTPPTATRSADALDPNPNPKTVTSVPPACEPTVGVMEVMRGRTSASKLTPPATSACGVLESSVYASPRLSVFTLRDRLKKPERLEDDCDSSRRHPNDVLSVWAFAIERSSPAASSS